MALVSRSSLTTRLMESCRRLQIKVNDGVDVGDEITLHLVADIDTSVTCARL